MVTGKANRFLFTPGGDPMATSRASEGAYKVIWQRRTWIPYKINSRITVAQLTQQER